MFKFYRCQLGEQTAEDLKEEVEDEVVTDGCREEMEKEQIDELEQFVTVVDGDVDVNFS
jgi:hypothetical protein